MVDRSSDSLGTLSLASVEGCSVAVSVDALFVRLKDDKSVISVAVAWTSGEGTRSQRACVGCVICGYCIVLVWTS